MTTSIGLCEIQLYLPMTSSLKQKRSQLKPLIARLSRTFNLSVAEVDHMDIWQSAKIAIVTVSNERVQNERVLRDVIRWIEQHFPDIMIQNTELEYF